jgi:hypothetical protein
MESFPWAFGVTMMMRCAMLAAVTILAMLGASACRRGAEPAATQTASAPRPGATMAPGWQEVSFDVPDRSAQVTVYSRRAEVKGTPARWECAVRFTVSGRRSESFDLPASAAPPRLDIYAAGDRPEVLLHDAAANVTYVLELNQLALRKQPGTPSPATSSAPAPRRVGQVAIADGALKFSP